MLNVLVEHMLDLVRGPDTGPACSYRNGSWQYDRDMEMPYRLERGEGTSFAGNPFVRGWKYAYRSFWGLCGLF